MAKCKRCGIELTVDNISVWDSTLCINCEREQWKNKKEKLQLKEESSGIDLSIRGNEE